MYTKGIWLFNDNDGIITCGDTSICEISGQEDEQEQMSNGHLIAAAPALLEACKEAQNIINQMLIPMSVRKPRTEANKVACQLCDAIAQAEKL